MKKNQADQKAFSVKYFYSTRNRGQALRRWLISWIWVLLTFGASLSSKANESVVFEIGVLPYVGLGELIKAYGPLASHLEKEMKQPVRIVTGRDYTDFLQKTQRRSYPLVITASHFARLAEREAGYVPILRPLNDYHVKLLVAAQSKVQQVKDLKSARIATPGMLAQTTMMGRVMLAKHGLNPNRDVSIIDAGNQKNALLAILHGDAEAGIVSEGAFRHMREEDRLGLREIKVEEGQRTSSIPVIYAVSPKISAAEREKACRHA
jgi:phosphonate transport system substrate-binding protein